MELQYFSITLQLKTGKAYKFTRPYRGPFFKIINLLTGGGEIQLVAKPNLKLIHVAFSQPRHCSREPSNVNVATHLSPSIPPRMLHSLIIDPVPDCTSDVGSYRSTPRSDPCLCAGLRAGIH